MKTALRWMQTGARACYLVAAWALIAMVFVQFFYAGSAVLVSPGNWQPHVNFGSMFTLMPGLWGMPALAALHPVNALLIFCTAYQAARSAWRLVVPNKK